PSLLVFLFIEVALQTTICYTVLGFWGGGCCTNSFTCKSILQLVIGLIQCFWFPKHHKYWVTAKTPTQRQGDSVGGWYGWGHNT
ncbi:mCG140814, partial [Mus musculus]